MPKKAIMAVLAGGFATAMAATIAVAVPAAAETGGRAVAAGQSAATGAADRPAYCDHIDKALTKRQAAVARLSGDANTRGSIAWLNAKAATATAAGNAEMAKLYSDRAALRSQVLDPLKLVVDDLAAVQKAHCS